MRRLRQLFAKSKGKYRAKRAQGRKRPYVGPGRDLARGETPLYRAAALGAKQSEQYVPFHGTTPGMLFACGGLQLYYHPYS